jgi:hypothetical protein
VRTAAARTAAELQRAGVELQPGEMLHFCTCRVGEGAPGNRLLGASQVSYDRQVYSELLLRAVERALPVGVGGRRWRLAAGRSRVLGPPAAAPWRYHQPLLDQPAIPRRQAPPTRSCLRHPPRRRLQNAVARAGLVAQPWFIPQPTALRRSRNLERQPAQFLGPGRGFLAMAALLVLWSSDLEAPRTRSRARSADPHPTEQGGLHTRDDGWLAWGLGRIAPLTWPTAGWWPGTGLGLGPLRPFGLSAAGEATQRGPRPRPEVPRIETGSRLPV